MKKILSIISSPRKLGNSEIMVKGWLLSMKSRFLEHKEELKQISLDCRKDGEWIKP